MIKIYAFLAFSLIAGSSLGAPSAGIKAFPGYYSPQEISVGYGTQNKRDLTGATRTIKANEIAKRPLTRVEQALQGTTPGVVVSSTSGQPVTPLSVRIRES